MNTTSPDDPGSMRRALLLFAETVMRPLIRMLLRLGLSYPEFNQIARRLFVDVAMVDAEFRVPRRKRQYKSRVACLTGLSRKEVLRLVDAKRTADTDLRSANRAARVFEAWTREPRYRDANGAPLPLPFRAGGGRPSFSELVNSYSGDIPPRAVLDELKRAGACSAADDDSIRIVAPYLVQPIDIDAITSAAFRIAASLAVADAALVDRPAIPARNPASSLHSSIC